MLGGVISALNCVCSRGDKVLVHSPTYIGFTRCLTDNGYDIVHSRWCRTKMASGGWTTPTWKSTSPKSNIHARHPVPAPTNPRRPRLGAVGAGKGHGIVQKV